MVNDMATHFEDSEPYLPEFMDDLRSCMNKFDDPELEKAADATWEGFVDFF